MRRRPHALRHLSHVGVDHLLNKRLSSLFCCCTCLKKDRAHAVARTGTLGSGASKLIHAWSARRSPEGGCWRG
eukprot:14033217-Alexandrium_andersonii.AAC.1